MHFFSSRWLNWPRTRNLRVAKWKEESNILGGLGYDSVGDIQDFETGGNTAPEKMRVDRVHLKGWVCTYIRKNSVWYWMTMRRKGKDSQMAWAWGKEWNCLWVTVWKSHCGEGWYLLIYWVKKVRYKTKHFKKSGGIRLLSAFAWRISERLYKKLLTVFTCRKQGQCELHVDDAGMRLFKCIFLFMSFWYFDSCECIIYLEKSN